MIAIEKDVLYYITLTDENGDEQELNLTKEQAKELYGKLGLELSKEWNKDLQEFFKKSKETPGTEKACDAVSDINIESPDHLDYNKIYTTEPGEKG
jgi:hypothetical protein